MHDQLVAHGRMDNFLRLAGRSAAPQKGPVFSDSDIYKWMEAAGFALQTNDHPELRNKTDAMIREVVAVQEAGGYLNTYYVADKKSLRMNYDVQTTGHELYNIGHLLQGAIAYCRATGDSTLLDAGVRFVDEFLLPNYGPGKGQKTIVSGHPEIEMALVELYRTTGRHEYLDLAGYILHGDERVSLTRQQVSYMYCGVPFVSRTKLEGHAVRAMYACCGATDYYLETGDQSYWKTLNTLWEDLTAHHQGLRDHAHDPSWSLSHMQARRPQWDQLCEPLFQIAASTLGREGDLRLCPLIQRCRFESLKLPPKQLVVNVVVELDFTALHDRPEQTRATIRACLLQLRIPLLHILAQQGRSSLRTLEISERCVEIVRKIPLGLAQILDFRNIPLQSASEDRVQHDIRFASGPTDRTSTRELFSFPIGMRTIDPRSVA